MRALFRCIVAAAAAVTLLSCSIKSDRSDCPCRLTIVLDSSPESVEFVMSRKGEQHLDTVLVSSDFNGGICELEIVKGSYVFSLHDGSAMVVQGCQADSLYAWSSVEELDATGDELTIYPDLGKQFATIFLEVLTEDAERCEYELAFDGSVEGLDLASLLPLGGNFHYQPRKEPSGEFAARIPRQRRSGGDLSLELRDEIGRTAQLPLAEYIAGTGYDWSEESLKDIYVSVNCGFSGFSIVIEDWHVGFSKEAGL